MNEHLLLVWCFPEDSEKTCMIYAGGEIVQCYTDLHNFEDMYPGVLYLEVIDVRDETEKSLERWNNPQAETSRKLASRAGLVSLLSHTTWGFVPLAGPSSASKTLNSTTSPLLARPPSEGQFASPLPGTSRIYGGRKTRGRRTRR